MHQGRKFLFLLHYVLLYNILISKQAKPQEIHLPVSVVTNSSAIWFYLELSTVITPRKSLHILSQDAVFCLHLFESKGVGYKDKEGQLCSYSCLSMSAYLDSGVLEANLEL